MNACPSSEYLRQESGFSSGGFGSSWVFSLGGIFKVVQAPLFDGFAFGILPFQQDGLSASDINVGRREIV